MTGNADTFISFALAQVGKPYVWGATGPNAYDCSGLVYAALKACGYGPKFRVTTGTLRMMGTSVSRADLQPGDLVFPDAGHVQIYLGGGKVVEAPRTGLNVRVVNMWGFSFARRLMPPATATYGGGAGKGATAPPTVPQTGAQAVGFSPLGPLAGWAKVAEFLVAPGGMLRIAEMVGGLACIFVAILGAEHAGQIVKTTGKATANAATA